MYGIDKTHNATHGSDCAKSAARELALIFGDGLKPKEQKVNIQTTFAFIKPHIVKSGNDKKILSVIKENG